MKQLMVKVLNKGESHVTLNQHGCISLEILPKKHVHVDQTMFKAYAAIIKVIPDLEVSEEEVTSKHADSDKPKHVDPAPATEPTKEEVKPAPAAKPAKPAKPAAAKE